MTTVGIVRFPCFIGRLEKNIGVAAIVANNEGYVACASRIIARWDG
jgi:hypothetical protein